MPLQHGVKRFEMKRLIKYVGSADSESTIELRSIEKATDYDHGYVARQWVCLEPSHRFISRNDGHSEIHEDQIGTDHACLTYSLKARRRFNSVVA